MSEGQADHGWALFQAAARFETRMERGYVLEANGLRQAPDR